MGDRVNFEAGLRTVTTAADVAGKLGVSAKEKGRTFEEANHSAFL